MGSGGHHVENSGAAASQDQRPTTTGGASHDTWLMAHVRGPEGIVVSLTERIG